MRGLFNLDSPIMRALSRVADLIILNLLFLVCCIPVVTIGAALTAMSYVTLKMKDDEGYVVRSFFKSFKQNFKQATVIWLILLAVLMLLVGDVFILRNMNTSYSSVMMVVIIFGLFVWVMEFTYVFPLLSRFYNSTKATMKNALLLAIANFPRTILMVAVQVAAVVVTFLTATTLWYGILVWFMAGFAVISFINSTLLHKVFEKLMPEEESDDDADIEKEEAFAYFGGNVTEIPSWEKEEAADAASESAEEPSGDADGESAQ